MPGSRQLDGDVDAQDGLALHARWVALRPRIIRPLGKRPRFFVVSHD